MLRIKKAPNDPQSMVQDGDSILKSLQNNSLPTVDLVIRESLQNSLDAQIPGSSDTVVEINVGTFDSEKFAVNFEEIDETLIKKYPGQQKVLSISDKNTKGLTGDFRDNSQESLATSNFQKLIFSLGKKQTAEGAGGSWGLGKTSYSLIGAGVVLYYTRVKVSGNQYEERLIGALIENPKDETKRLLSKNERGIAWWGEYANDGETIYPITNPDEIERILNILGIERYVNTTGTTVIIPYLQNEGNKTKEILVDELKMAVQRWYGPRLMNEDYTKITGNSKLVCTVNGDTLLPDFDYNFDIAFKYIRDLYTSALLGSSTTSQIITQPIYGRNRSFESTKTLVGYISFMELSRKDLLIDPPHNEENLLVKCLLTEEDEKSKGKSNIVIAHARKPGMVVSYAYNDGWTPNIKLENDQNMILGFFVPVSTAKLNPRHEKLKSMGCYDLESYLRGIEKADHADWTDVTYVTIVKYIKEDIQQVLKREYEGEELKSDSQSSLLSRKFGNMFMPPRNFGKKSTTPSKKIISDHPKSKVNRKCHLMINGTQFVDENNIEVYLSITLKSSGRYQLLCETRSSERDIDYREWKKSISETLEYPFSFSNIQLNNETNNLLINEDLNINTTNEKIIINYNGEETLELSGKMFIKVNNHQYSPTITISEVV